MNSTEIALERVKSRMLEYLKLNQRDKDELLKKKGADFSIALYQECANAAPTRGQIAQKVKSLGWRVKRRKGAWKRRPGESGAQVLQRMQNSVINARARHRYYVASGYLPAVYRLRGSGSMRKKTAVPVKNPRGSVQFIGFGSARSSIIITNSTPGVVYSMEKTNGVERAAERVERDLLTYILRKRKEAAQRAGLGNA